MGKETKRILLVSDCSLFRQALAICVNQQEDLEVAWQAASISDTRSIPLEEVDGAIVDPAVSDGPDGEGLKLIQRVSAANRNTLVLVLSHRLDPAAYPWYPHYQRVVGAGAIVVEEINANTGIEEVIEALRSSATEEPLLG